MPAFNAPSTSPTSRPAGRIQTIIAWPNGVIVFTGCACCPPLGFGTSTTGDRLTGWCLFG